MSIEDQNEISKTVSDGLNAVSGLITVGTDSLAHGVKTVFGSRDIPNERPSTQAPSAAEKLHNDSYSNPPRVNSDKAPVSVPNLSIDDASKAVTTTSKNVGSFINDVVAASDSVSKVVSGTVANAIHNDMQQKARDAATIAMVDRVSSTSTNGLSDMFGAPAPKNSPIQAPIINEAPSFAPKAIPVPSYNEIKNTINSPNPGGIVGGGFDISKIATDIGVNSVYNKPEHQIASSPIRQGFENIVGKDMGGMTGPAISSIFNKEFQKPAENASPSSHLPSDLPKQFDFKPGDVPNKLSDIISKNDGNIGKLPEWTPKNEPAKTEAPGPALTPSLNPSKIDGSPLTNVPRAELPSLAPKVEAPAPAAPTPLTPRVDTPVSRDTTVSPRVETPGTPRVETPGTPRVETPGRTDTSITPGRTDTSVTPKVETSGTPRIDTPGLPGVKADGSTPGTNPRTDVTVPGKTDVTAPKTDLTAPKTDGSIGGKTDGSVPKTDNSTLPGRSTDNIAAKVDTTSTIGLRNLSDQTHTTDAKSQIPTNGLRNEVTINPLTGKPEIQSNKVDSGIAPKTDARVAPTSAETNLQVNKLDGRVQQTQLETGKVLQGRVEAQNNVNPALTTRDAQTGKVAQAENTTAVRNNLTGREDAQLGGTKPAINQLNSQLDGKGSLNPTANRAEGNAIAGNRVQQALNPNGRAEAQVAQPGVKTGNAAIGGALTAGGRAADGAAGVPVTGKAIREISGGRYLTGVEIGLLIAAVGIAKSRSDARSQGQKPGDLAVAGGPKSEFNSCKGFLTEKASRINELTVNVRRFPGKEITLSAMLAITGAAAKHADHTQGMGNRSLDYNVRIERTVGAQASSKTSKEDLIAAALFSQADPELSEEKKEETQSNLDTQLLGFLPSPALWRSRRKNEGDDEKEGNNDAVNDDVTNANAGLNGYRRAIRIKAADTLLSIAEREYQDANLAWLIADINFDRTTQHEMDGKRVVEVIKGQELQLPLESEIAEFYNRRGASLDPDNLITIVVENEINRDRLNEDLKDILGIAR